MKFEVIWHYEGNSWWKYKSQEKTYQEEYTDIYNKFCDVTNNGLIDALNSEWDKLHPGPDNCNNDAYMAFMATGYQKAVDRLRLKSSHIPSFKVGPDANLIGCLDCGGDLYFTLRAL